MGIGVRHVKKLPLLALDNTKKSTARPIAIINDKVIKVDYRRICKKLNENDLTSLFLNNKIFTAFDNTRLLCARQ